MQVFAGVNLNATKYTCEDITKEILRTDITHYTDIDMGITYINKHQYGFIGFKIAEERDDFISNFNEKTS